MRGKRIATRSLTFVVATTLAACTAVYSTKEYVGGVKPDAAAACSPNRETDPDNCGACGHKCHLTQCVGGICDPELFAPTPGESIDVSGDDIYVASATEIIRLPKKGEGRAQPVAGPLPRIGNIRVTSEEIYVFRGAGDAGPPGIDRLTLDGVPAGSIDIPGEPYTGVPDEGSLYYFDRQNTLWVIDHFLKGAPRKVLTGAGDITFDATHLYVIEAPLLLPKNRLWRAAKDGSNPEEIARGPELRSVRQDGDAVYFSDSKEGAIYRLPKDGRAVEPLVSGKEFPNGIDADGEFFTWCSIRPETLLELPIQGRVYRVPKKGGAPMALTGLITFTSLTHDAEFIYWLQPGSRMGIYRVPK